MDLEKDKMDTLQRLAQVNIEISAGKAILQNLKVDVEDFLKEREILEKGVIDRVRVESKQIIDEIHKDFSKIDAYYNEIRSYTGFLKELQENIHTQVETFKETSQNFIEYIALEQHKLSEQRKDIQSDRNIIENELESIKKMKEQISKDTQYLESQQATLTNSYKEIKKQWKIQK
jgi:chromosome segregation ATPase